MSESTVFPPAPARLSSGVTGIDTITGGGLFKAGIYIVVGSPGSGKTTCANQACFNHVKKGGRAAYVSLLSETYGRMLSQMQSMTFFDRSAVGDSIYYVNGFTTMEAEGLDGLLKLLRRTVREHRADFLVLDGMVTASVIAKSNIDYKKFINELQTWVGVIGCTVLLLTSSATTSAEPEYTMVDGIIELSSRRLGLRHLRELTVIKFRGSGYVEGSHPYEIANEGLVVYPRVEGVLAQGPAHPVGEPVGTGVARLDQVLGGGVLSGSTTLLLGSPGAGKTSLGLHFLAAGAKAAEPGLHFGFYENPPDLVAKGQRLGLGLREMVDRGSLQIIWQPPAEKILDALAYQLVLAARTMGAKRVFIDGLVGFNQSAYPERLPGFFCVLTEELRSLGITTFITEDTRDLFAQAISVPAVSAMFDNILFLRHQDGSPDLRRVLSVLKTRDRRHDQSAHELEITDRGVVMGEKPAGLRT